MVSIPLKSIDQSVRIMIISNGYGKHWNTSSSHVQVTTNQTTNLCRSILTNTTHRSASRMLQATCKSSNKGSTNLSAELRRRTERETEPYFPPSHWKNGWTHPNHWNMFLLVVEPPLWKIWTSIGMIVRNICKYKTCSKPPTSKSLKHVSVNVERPHLNTFKSC